MEKLMHIIPFGKDNAIHQEELASRLGVTPAVAKQMVRQARLNGLQILSSTCGYWFAENDYEKKAFVMLMRKQAFSRLKSAQSIRYAHNGENYDMSLSDAFNEVSEEGLDEQE